jgi:hypothetical protein
MNASTWYCAQVLEKLPDRIKVSYFTTENSSLKNFCKSTYEERCENLENVGFHKTWALSDGSATTIAPEISKKKSVLWTGQIPLVFLNDQLLVRNVGLSSQGKLDSTTIILAAKLKIPHQVGP